MDMNTCAARKPHGLYRPEYEHDACGIGALAHLKGARSHQMLDDALSVLVNLEHRGGVGLERNTGDGAGVLFQVPHRFFRKEAQKEGQLLPDEGDYGVAMLFLMWQYAWVAAGEWLDGLPWPPGRNQRGARPIPTAGEGVVR